MYDHHLREMAECLAKAGVITKADTEKAKAVLDEYWEDKMAISWGIDDVIGLAKEHGKVVTEEQACDVLAEALHRHDATVGINWDVLDMYIDGLGELPECESEGNDE